jgi:hypothetical protein
LVALETGCGRSQRLHAHPKPDRHGWRPLLRILRSRHLSIHGLEAPFNSEAGQCENVHAMDGVMLEMLERFPARSKFQPGAVFGFVVRAVTA